MNFESLKIDLIKKEIIFVSYFVAIEEQILRDHSAFRVSMLSKSKN